MERYLEKLNRLNSSKISHSNWNDSLQKAYILMLSASAGEVICITGPSRSGKSKLIYELKKLIEAGKNFEKLDLMPVVVVEAVNDSVYGSFSTKSFTLSMLSAINHPFYGTMGFQESQKVNRIGEGVLRTSLVKGLKSRGTKYLFIDEAQHVKYVGKNALAPFAVLDSWKCLANQAGIVLIIVGAYPILEILRNSPHILGRKYSIHLSRYRQTLKDLEEFLHIVSCFGLAIGEEKVLVDNLEILYRGSVGCIGLLRAWLIEAIALSFVRKSRLTKKILIETISSDDDLKEIFSEIRNGEKLLESHIFDKIPKMINKSENSNELSTAKAKFRPGNRKPSRLKIKNREGGE